MKKQVLRIGAMTAGFLLLVFLDQITKIWAVETLMDKSNIVLIPSVLEFSYVENTGMAFGLFQDGRIFFFIATGLFSVVMIYAIIRTPAAKRFLPMNLLLTVVFAGAVGNLIDRVFRQYVVDFIYVKIIDFPVFNLADIYVTVGIVFLAAFLLLYYKDKELNEVYGLKRKKKRDAVQDASHGEEAGKDTEDAEMPKA